MEARRALVVALVAAGAAVGIVAADTAFGLHLSVEAQDGDAWTTSWQDPSRVRERYHHPFPEACGTRTFRVVADNDKPLPDSVDVKVTYWNNATRRTTTLLEEHLELGAFERRTLEFTVPAEAGAGPEYGRPAPDFKPPVYAHVLFDGGYATGGFETQVCVTQEGGA